MLGVVVALALLLAGVHIATEQPDGAVFYHDRPGRLVWLSMAVLRSLLGVDDFPRQADNPAHEALATVASVIGTILPALIIAIVIVRIFAIRVFEWRRQVSIVLGEELDGGVTATVPDRAHAFLAVRWYKRLDNLSITNFQADAYLRCRTKSLVDGSTMYRYQPLDVLGLDGEEAPNCVWPETFSGMPFTLWIPLRAPLDAGRIAEVQGRSLGDTDDRQLVVRLSGTMAQPGSQISEEMRYDLTKDIQIGRFVPVEPDLAVPARKWPGWNRFEEGIVHGIFVYGSSADPDELLTLLGRWPGDGDVVRAQLTGYRRSWRKCVGETLYPTVLPERGAVTEGLLVRVLADQLTLLDVRHHGYDRLKVTGLVRSGRDNLADVVWTYAANPGAVALADRAIEEGTAQISRTYLDRLRGIFAVHEGLAEAFDREGLPAGVAVADP